MSAESHELALTAINEGSDYQKRLEIARRDQTIQTVLWAGYATHAARGYMKDHGTPGDAISSVFSTVDMLLAAAELAEYYEQHIQEVDAA